MKKRIVKQKLVLGREVVKELTQPDLAQVAGGMRGCSCINSGCTTATTRTANCE